jgi:hypothetical protein
VARLANIVDRLPSIYRDGEILEQFLGPAALALEIADEDTIEVRRAHWIDEALEHTEIARLAALLDIAAEPWLDTTSELRAWVRALVEATADHGAVTVDALRAFVDTYVHEFTRVTKAQLPLVAGNDGGLRWADGAAELVEWPRRLRTQRVPEVGGLEPLTVTEVRNDGLDPTPLGFCFTGLPEAPEHAPVVVNLTTGTGIALLDSIQVGERVWCRPEPDDSVRIVREGVDITSRARGVRRVEPGRAWERADVGSPRAITVVPGPNLVWFLPLAHYDVPGLDRALMALADDTLREGRFDATSFDQSLFFQDPAVVARMWWVETQPATIRVTLAGGAMLTLPSAARRSDVDATRASIEQAIGEGIGRLAAAGVATSAEVTPLREHQPQADLLTTRLPLVRREGGPTGAPSLPAKGGVFDTTTYDESLLG